MATTGRLRNVHPKRFVSAAALLSLLSVGLFGCSSEQRSSDPAAEPSQPAVAFAPHTRGVPAGFREARCPGAGADGTGLVVRLVVPERARSMDLRPGRCSFGWGIVGGVSVILDPSTTLATVKKKELEPFEDSGGDDDINQITYAAGRPGFGEASAERLDFRVYNDGLPFWQRSLQSAGVRVGISVGEKHRADLDELETIRVSVGVLAGRRARCPGWGAGNRATVSFVPPAATAWVSRESRWCRFSFEDSPTTLEYGILDPRPVSLERQLSTLRRDPEVSDLRVERGVARLAGEPADRITWWVVRTEETENYEPPGTWRMVSVRNNRARVEWGQTPRWWRQHTAIFTRLLRTVRPVTAER